MEDSIKKLRAEREILQGRLRKINAAIDGYEQWSKDVADLLGDDNGVTVDAGDTGETPQTPIAEFEAAVRDLFGRMSAPLKRTEVYEELTKAGVVVGGKEPLNTVASRLSRMEGVTNLKGFGYWLEDRPYSAAGHPPSAPAAASLFTVGGAEGTLSREGVGIDPRGDQRAEPQEGQQDAE